MNMKNFIVSIFCLVIVFFQLSVEGAFFSSRQIPDLALALAITLVLALGFRESIKWIFLIGILIDSGSSAAIGTSVLAYFLIGWAISRFSHIADIRSRKILFMAAFAFFVAISEIFKDYVMLGSLKAGTLFFGKQYNPILNIFSADYSFKIIFTIIAAYIIYYLFRRASRTFFLEPVRFVKN